jgi:cystathionine beta-lyase
MSASGAPSGGSGSASSTKKAFPRVDLQGNDLPPSPAPSSPHAGRRYNIATELVFTEGNDQYNASSVPIYQVGLHHHRMNGAIPNLRRFKY